MILVGDIGGTHTRLALVHDGPGIPMPEHVARFENARHHGLDEILRAYAPNDAKLSAFCLAVAGPTNGRSVRLTNLDWHLDAGDLEARFGVPRTRFLNDFAAVGWGLNALGTADQHLLQTGQRRAHAPRLALGAGTGLGVSLCVMHCDGSGSLHAPLPSEGGHIGFAPVNAQQDRLLAFLRRRYERVSVERILSGPGIAELYAFCLDEVGLDPAHGLAPRDISQAALNHSDSLASEALRLFAAILGQVAGDLALVAQAEGGVYIAGGIAPQILPVLKGPEFLQGFHAKGRYREWMQRLPVSVVTDPNVGLKGVALAGRLGA